MKNIFTLCALIICTPFFSQVNYTDVDPDVVLQSVTSDSYAVDFNGDLVMDVIIYETQLDTNLSGFPITFTGAALSPLYNNEVIGKVLTLGTETILTVDTISSGQIVDGSSSYVNTTTPSVFPGIGLRVLSSGAFSTTIGEFEGDIDGYFGVKFDISGNTHYGWVRISPSVDGTTCIVKDYAYESTSGTGILGGDMGSGFVGFNSSQTNTLKIDLLQNNNEFSISGGTGVVYISVFNLLGENVVNKIIENNNSFNLEQLNSGIYLINIKAGNQHNCKKIYID